MNRRRDPGEKTSVLDYLREAERFPSGRPAYRWREGVRWRTRSWGEVLDGSRAAARALEREGVGAGDRVLLQGSEGPELVEALLGVFLRGASAVPLETETSRDFLAAVAVESGARILVAPAGSAPPMGGRLLALGSWDRARPGGSEDPELSAETEAEVVFTSGTTGRPKGVVLTHGNLMAALRGIEKGYRKRERRLEWLAPLTFLSTLPLSHMFGQALSVFLPLMMGLTVVFAPPRPAEVCRASRRWKAWGIFGVPRLMDLLRQDLRRDLRVGGRLDAFERRRERWSGRSRWIQCLVHHRVQRRFGWRMRVFVVGGAPMPGELRRFWDELGYLVVVGYGLTETAPIVSVSNPFLRGEENVGRPASNQEVRIGPDGEVLVRGPNVAAGYLGRDEEGTFEEGWLHTGDLGELDPDGRLLIRGRLKDVIVTPEGENVHAGDVEEVLEGLEGVREAAVVGLAAGDGSGERVHAVLTLVDGVQASDVMGRANERLPAKQRIRGVTLWPEPSLPRTRTGKVRKGAVRRAVEALRKGSPMAEALEASRRDVRTILSELSGVARADLSKDTRLVEDLGLGSLDLVELTARLEEACGLELREEELASATVGGLEELTAEGRGEAARPAAGAPKAVSDGRVPGEGRLRIPRWPATRPVQVLRRALEEALVFPFVRFHARPRVAWADARSLEEFREAAPEPPWLVVANHPSHFDTGLLKAVLPRPVGGRLAPGGTTRHHRLAFGLEAGPWKTTVKQRIQMALVQLFFNVWPLPEGTGFRRSLEHAGRLADRGYSLLIYPQGRLTAGEHEAPFRPGIGIFARDLGLPVLPVWIDGTDRVLPPGRYWPHRRRTRVVLGRALRLRDGESPESFTERLEGAVRALAPE